MEDDVRSSGMRMGYPVTKSLLLTFFGRGGRAEISGMRLEFRRMSTQRVKCGR